MAMSYYIEDEAGNECEISNEVNIANSAVKFGEARPEQLLLVDKNDGVYTITGVTDRKFAEKNNLRHLTTICVAYIADGIHKGKWIVHNRYHKQIAKGLQSPVVSYNLFGGHCTPGDYSLGSLMNVEVSEKFLRAQMLRELSEELLEKGDPSIRWRWDYALEVWENGKRKLSDGVPATTVVKSHYVTEKSLVPVGFTEYSDEKNSEYSFVFALPVASFLYNQLVAADDYYVEEDHSKRRIMLPLTVFSEDELKAMALSVREVEVCDSISRLFDEVNLPVLEKLRLIIGSRQAVAE